MVNSGFVKFLSALVLLLVICDLCQRSAATQKFCGKALAEALDSICVNGYNTKVKKSSYFWHITDLHLDTMYSTQGDVLRSCWRKNDRQPPSSSSRSPGRFGDYLCDSPWSLIESAAKAMKSRQGDNVEFVLWTGDGLSHSSHGMFESKKLEILRNITDLLGRTFSSQFVFPVLGDEEAATTNFRHMGELWRHWLPSEALQTFEKGGYYSIEQTKSRLRIIALNTNFMRHDPKYSQSHLAAVRQRGQTGHGDASEYKNFYYHHGNVHQHHGHANGDWMSSSSSSGSASSSSSSTLGYGYNGHHRGIGTIPGTVQDLSGNGGRVSALSEFENQEMEKQWIWLEDVLSKSKNNKETVYIVGHIPPGSDERHIGVQQIGHTTFTESNNKRYLELVRKYSSIIQGQFFGHLHSDSFRIIYDDKGKPVSWMMISPSVTPRKMSIGSNNPAMRLYKFDTDSGQVLDYTQYYLDLQLANTMGEPNWQPEYNLTHYYGLNDISAISLHNFVDRFTSNDASWFAKYYRANTVRYSTDPCDGVCLLNHYCAITRVDYKEFRQCLEKERSALTSDAAPPIAPATPTLVLSTTCPMLALLFTLAASCCRSVLTLLPKLMGACGPGGNSSSSSNHRRSSNNNDSILGSTRPSSVTLRLLQLLCRRRSATAMGAAGDGACLQRPTSLPGGVNSSSDDADILYCERTSDSTSGGHFECSVEQVKGHASHGNSDRCSDSARFGQRFVGWARIVVDVVVGVVFVVVLALGLPVVRIIRNFLQGVVINRSKDSIWIRSADKSNKKTKFTHNDSNINHDDRNMVRQQHVASRPSATHVQ